MKSITEIRKISTERLYRLCNEKCWYNRGTNEEYEAMFDLANGNLTTERLTEVAKDIVAHTAPSEFAYIDSDPVLYVLYELSEISHSMFDYADGA